MNNKFFKLGAVVVLTLLFSAMAFAQTTWFVNSTNGDDLINNGRSATQTAVGVGPFAKIATAITAASDGDIISIAAGAYGEANVSITKSLSFVSTTFLASNVVTITNGVDINGATKTVNIGLTAGGSLQFNLGALATALKLTAGTLNIDAANVTIASGGTITRTAATINATPTVTNVNVTYDGTADIAAGPEVPASMGTGVLTVSITAGKTATFANAVSFKKPAATALSLTSGNATFNGLLTFDPGSNLEAGHMVNSGSGTLTASAGVTYMVWGIMQTGNYLDNTGGGNISIPSTVTINKSTTAVASVTLTLQNSSATGGSGTLGIVSISSLVVNSYTSATPTTYTPAVTVVNNSTGAFTFNGTAAITSNLTNAAAGTVTLAGGTVTGNVANANGGTIVLNANQEFKGDLDNGSTAGGTIKLNTFTLTMSKVSAAITATAGKIISVTSGTAGTGVFKVTSTTAAVVTNGGTAEWPNITVSGTAGGLTLAGTNNVWGNVSITAGTLTVTTATVNGTLTMSGGGLTLGAGGLTLTGDYSQSGGVLNLGAGGYTFTEKANWTATGGTVTYGDGTLQFGSGTSTSANQVFTPIPNLQIYNLTINNPSMTVSLGASVVIMNNVTITKGTVDLSTYNIRMQKTGGGGAFATPALATNGGYVSSGGGTLIWEVDGSISGSGTFSNMDIRLTAGGVTNYVRMTSSITFSGNLYLRGGDLDINANTLTFSNVLVRPIVYKNVAATFGTANIVDVATGGAIAFATGTDYDLQYYGDASWAAGSFKNEWQPTKLHSLTIATGTGVRTVTPPAGAITMTGNLTIYKDQTLDLSNAGTLTASGVSAAHSIIGSISNGTLDITGNSATLAGAATTAGAASVNNLTITGTGISVTNLQAITGNLTITGATASVVMNTTSAVISGNVIVNETAAADAAILTMASTTSTITGNVGLTQGAFTLTKGSVAAQQKIGGTLTLTAGTLTLGSNLEVTGATSHLAGILDNGTKSFKVTGAYTHNGVGTVTGTGNFIIAHTGNQAFTLTTALTIPNLVLNCTVKTAVVTLTTSNLTVSNSFTATMGTFDLNALNLIITGNTVTVNPAAVADVVFQASVSGTLQLKGDAVVFTAGDDVTIPTTGMITVNSLGTVTLKSDKETAATPVKRTFSVGTLTMTAGNLATGINDVIITTLFDRSASGAGNISQGSGKLIFNTATAFKQGTAFAVDNLEIDQSISGNPVGTAFTVNKLLVLKAGTLTMTAGKLTFADGATVERQLTTALLSSIPTFPTSNNFSVSYTTAEAAAITTANEMPAIVMNLTVNRTAGGGVNDMVNLAANTTVNGTIYLTAGVLNKGSKTLTLAAGGTINRTAGIFTVGKAPTVTTYNLVYGDAAATTTTAEDFQAGLLSLSYQSATTGGTLTLHASQTVDGPITLNTVNSTTSVAGLLDLNGKTLTVNGNFTVTAGDIQSTPSAGLIVFAGTAAQTLTVPAAGYTFPSTGSTFGVVLQINNSSTSGVTLAGGNLTIDNTAADMRVSVVKFTKGVFKTGANVLTLWQDKDASNQPVQGFTRNVASGFYSHVVGNVKKFIDRGDLVKIAKVDFPVGSAPTSPGYYRPFTMYFKTAPANSINMTVAHVNSRPGGANGYPIRDGGLVITNYPDFFWFVKSDISLAPSYQFDMEAQAEGYADYASDGIQNLRFVRRDSGLVNNQWVMQKDVTTGSVMYDNSTIAANWPAVKVISATGGVTAQGSIFTYSQINKAPAFAATPTDQTVNEGAVVSLTFSATDPDLGDGVTMSVVSKPDGSTFDVATGAFAWTVPYTLATKTTPTATATVKIRATDNYGPLYADKTVTITVNNVNRKPDFAAAGAAKLAAQTIKDGQALGFTYIAPDVDADAVTYVGVGLPTGATVSTAGALAWTPTFAQAGSPYTITVVASDGLLTDTTSAVVTVNRSVVRGDVDKNGTLGNSDVSLILQHVVGLITITDPAAAYAADANGSGTISAYDAALTLQAAAGLITLPAVADESLGKVASVDAAGSLSWTAPEATNDAEVVKISLGLSNSASVYAVQLSSKIDAGISIDGVNAALPDGWEMKWNVVDNELRVAMAGATPLPSGSVATVMVRLKNNEGRINFATDALLNENFQSLGAVEIAAVPTVFALGQNYPNPFNPSTTIKYQIANEANVSLDVYNLQGQKIRTLVAKEQKAGYYSVVWDGRNEAGQTVSSGLYLYRVQAGSFVATHKMLLIK